MSHRARIAHLCANVNGGPGLERIAEPDILPTLIQAQEV